MGTGVAIFITELWRDPEGRGSVLQGAIDGPQIAAVVLVLAGALVLRERKHARHAAPSTIPYANQDAVSDRAAQTGEGQESS
jgi:phosphatidylglycerol:prolipoprotein diacylglycerol transferase